MSRKLGFIGVILIVIVGIASLHSTPMQPAAVKGAATDTSASQSISPSPTTAQPNSTSTDTSSGGSSLSDPSTSDTTTTDSSSVGSGATDTSSSDNTGVNDTNLSNDNTYTNSDGTNVHSPADSTDGTVPVGATAQCVDGTYSFSQHHSGTCSYHGGVAQWLN